MEHAVEVESVLEQKQKVIGVQIIIILEESESLFGEKDIWIQMKCGNKKESSKRTFLS